MIYSCGNDWILEITTVHMMEIDLAQNNRVLIRPDALQAGSWQSSDKAREAQKMLYCQLQICCSKELFDNCMIRLQRNGRFLLLFYVLLVLLLVHTQ